MLDSPKREKEMPAVVQVLDGVTGEQHCAHGKCVVSGNTIQESTEVSGGLPETLDLHVTAEDPNSGFTVDEKLQGRLVEVPDGPGEMQSGPSKVSTVRYRRNYNRIFGNRKSQGN